MLKYVGYMLCGVFLVVGYFLAHLQAEQPPSITVPTDAVPRAAGRLPVITNIALRYTTTGNAAEQTLKDFFTGQLPVVGTCYGFVVKAITDNGQGESRSITTDMYFSPVPCKEQE